MKPFTGERRFSTKDEESVLIHFVEDKVIAINVGEDQIFGPFKDRDDPLKMSDSQIKREITRAVKRAQWHIYTPSMSAYYTKAMFYLAIYEGRKKASDRGR